MSKKGFTLAEILITLTVIGVVAALTIPTLLQNTQQAELKTALKRDFADLNQAAIQIKTNNGGTFKAAWSGDSSFKNSFLPYLNVIKNCEQGAAEGCWYRSDSSDTDWFYLNSTTPVGVRNNPSLILSNGVMLRFCYGNSNCDITLGVTPTTTGCGKINFDVNGFKKPNTIGKDIFTVYIDENELLPIGAKRDNDCPSGYGDDCTTKYLYE